MTISLSTLKSQKHITNILQGVLSRMTNAIGIPKGAIVAVNDLMDHCAKIEAGQEVVLLAHMDGLCGGDNLVDEGNGPTRVVGRDEFGDSLEILESFRP